jgi:hypothetical protein
MATEWKCLNCGKAFKVGDWTCTDGVSNHSVAEKIYRSLDAPQDIGYADTKGTPLDGSSFGETIVCNIPPPRKQIGLNGEVSWVGEGSVTFIRGRFATSDPVQQYWLDQKPGYNHSEEEWSAKWLSQAQRLQLRESELHAREQRLENDRNELLAKTKQKVNAAA